MTEISDKYALALAAELRAESCANYPWYMTTLESIRCETIEAIKAGPGQKSEALAAVLWRHTSNCLRIGPQPNIFIINLRSNPIFEVWLFVDEDLRLIRASIESDSLSESLFEMPAATKYVAVFYQNYLVHLARRLKLLSQSAADLSG
ncbi:MAG: hypothetical protein ACPG1C_12320 [Alphaproteobacteria bacterium]